MRSKLAWIIAIGALLPLISSVAQFASIADGNFNYGVRAIQGGAWITIGGALTTPLSLFGTAAIVEMLFRVSERLPITTPTTPSPLGRFAWRSTLAKVFLGIAAFAYAMSAWAVWRFFTERSVTENIAAGTSTEFVFSLIFEWLTGPLYIVGLAAVIEYLSRIAAALHRPGYTP
jgi:hypothetical protein